MTKPKNPKPEAKGSSEILKFDKSKSAAKGNGKASAKKKTHKAPGAALERPKEPFKLGAAGLDPIVGNPTFEQYSAYVDHLFRLGNSATWAIGDLLLYGETRQDWAEMYAQVIDESKKSVDSLMNFRNIAKKFPVERRRALLSFSHHRVLAPLQEVEQDKWLDICEKEGLSVKQLQERLKDAHAKTAPELPYKTGSGNDVVSLVFAVGKDARQAITEAAKHIAETDTITLGEVKDLVSSLMRSAWETEALANRESALINRNEKEQVATVVVTKIQTIADSDGDVAGDDLEDPPL